LFQLFLFFLDILLKLRQLLRPFLLLQLLPLSLLFLLLKDDSSAQQLSDKIGNHVFNPLDLGTIVAIHYSKKRTITGCVKPAPNGMIVNDEKDKLVYIPSGDTTGVTPGERMRLRGKKVKSTGPDKTLVWEAREVTKDFGVCQP
jgi:hypothetical protein